MVENSVIFLLIIILIVIITVVTLTIRNKRKNKTIQSDIQSNIQNNQTTIQNLQSQLNSISSSLQNLPRSAEVDLISKNVESMEQNFESLNEDVTMKSVNMETKINDMNRLQTEKLSDVEKKIFKETTEKILSKATEHITETSVNKEEFDRLKSRIETLIGAEIDATRLSHLNSIFGDTDRKDVLTWKCKTIKLLRGGLAPQAEEDVLVLEGITMAKAKKFLKELSDMGVVDQKKIESYWLNENFQWLTKYMDDVELLIHRIKQTVKNEKNYEKYIKENLNLIEDGLILENQQYVINDENKVDLVCVDKNGLRLFIELKYPLAKAPDKFQLVRYREAITTQSEGMSARFMIIAPSIPNIIKETMSTDNLEFREISY